MGRNVQSERPRRKRPGEDERNTPRRRHRDPMTHDDLVKAAAKAAAKRDGWSDEEQIRKNGITTEWRLGGAEGGSYRGDENVPFGADPEPAQEVLDETLVAVVPHLTFVQYRELVKAVVTYDEYTEHGYYGDYTRYGRKSVDLTSLHKWLVRNVEGEDRNKAE